ncbi:hypothetical protein PAECIP111893_00126 [Paenibacillus plantiphilus]|uniref:Uncharacterized protein n=1 Tax=Paenibacillus plantiphilus TaxID=2905650 RepID=A0ABN8FV76_9BACL|nr:hypothetical protein PAECIP111893_00126 [Paenibacillus plantiphilus]
MKTASTESISAKKLLTERSKVCERSRKREKTSYSRSERVKTASMESISAKKLLTARSKVCERSRKREKTSYSRSERWGSDAEGESRGHAIVHLVVIRRYRFD